MTMERIDRSTDPTRRRDDKIERKEKKKKELTIHIMQHAIHNYTGYIFKRF